MEKLSDNNHGWHESLVFIDIASGEVEQDRLFVTARRRSPDVIAVVSIFDNLLGTLLERA